MAAKLLIVESSTKAKHIAHMLGPDWEVRASVGHVRDLPKMGMNVERSGAYAMTYEIIPGKADVVARLRAAVKAAGRNVYLATDPDREGESIAWHLEVLLRLRDPHRVTYHEVTPAAVKAAIANPGRIDRNLVAAQETRRALDRLYGYDVSSALSRKLGGKRSAGRVQTIGLRLIVDRERDIANFKPRDHYTVVLTMAGAPTWTAEWAFRTLLPAPKNKETLLWTDKAFADRVAAIRAVRVTEYEETVSSSAPPGAFTSSTLVQTASNRLRFGAKRTMQIAQSLFEDGHITYHRTDSPNLSDEAIAAIRQWAAAQGLELPKHKRTFKAKEAAQGAHEAIRPTKIDCAKIASLSTDAMALYDLIRLRAIASQLADATFDVRTAVLDAGAIDDKAIYFAARGSTLRTPGWKALYGVGSEAAGKDGPGATNPVPKLTVGATPRVESGKRVDKQTEPPPRYTEASLVKKLESEGIGRPSTYASIVETIQARGYVAIDKDRFFRPLPAGSEVIDALCGAFAFVEVDYTRQMEERLDAIAGGKATYVDVVRDADTALTADLERFGPVGPDNRPLAVTAGTCPVCAKGAVAKRTRKDGSGIFWSCNAYPICKASWPDVEGAPDLLATQRAPVVDGPQCPNCRKAKLRLRKGTRGVFWGCAGYPECRALYHDVDGKPDLPPPKRKKAS